jgi:hypothetical protein
MQRLTMLFATLLIVSGCAVSTEPPDSSTTVTTALPPMTTLAEVGTTTTTHALTTTAPTAPTLDLTLAPGTVVDTYRQTFSGRTDPGVTVTINDIQVPVDEDGLFTLADWWNTPGSNVVAVTAVNPYGLTRSLRVPYEFDPRDGWVAFVGDSIMRGATPEIEERFGEDTVHALSGRRFDEGTAVVEEIVETDHALELLIIGLGSNGPVQPDDLDEIMRLAAEVPRVAFVNVRVDRRWEDDSNRELDAGVERHASTMLIDWYTASEDVERLLRSDRVHPTSEGFTVLAELIASAVFPHWSTTRPNPPTDGLIEPPSG